MGPQISRAADKNEFFTPEGCYIVESWNTKADKSVSVARARVLPGVTTRAHRLCGTEERYLMIEGAGKVSVGGMSAQEVGPGDVVYIPAGTSQQISNTGETDMVFYAICTPPFAYANYEALD